MLRRDGYHTPIPYLEVDDAAAAIEFYREAFGASERLRIGTPDGKVGHAELEIGDSLVMVCDPLPHFATRSPKELGGTSVGVFIYVEDADAAQQRAADAGATIVREPADMFWGDRFGVVSDPFGHVWLIATNVEDLSADEIAARTPGAPSPSG